MTYQHAAALGRGGGTRGKLTWEGTMKKLILDLDALQVEAFEVTAERGDSRGTVLGAEAFFTGPQNCVTISCGDSEIRACREFI
jgi:hypothetical protein